MNPLPQIWRSTPGGNAWLLLAVLFSLPLPCSAQLIDAFASLDGWHAVHTHGEGASIVLTSGEGRLGNAMLMDFAFMGYMGGVMARKEFPRELPDDFQFSFDMKAEAPVNNFEFRLVDSLGNVWWNNRLNYAFPREWKTIHVKRRQFTYAWGPSWGGDIHRLERIEFNISPGTGGRGRVWIGNLRLDTLTSKNNRPFIVRAEEQSLNGKQHPISGLRDTMLPVWRSSQTGSSLALRLRGQPDIGGMTMTWDSVDYAKEFTLETSVDGVTWTNRYAVHSGAGGRQYVPLQESPASHVRMKVLKSSRGRGVALHRLQVLGPEFSQSMNDLYQSIADESSTGDFPKYFTRAQSYWTLVGVSGGKDKALMNEQGMVETGRLRFSLEPFLWIDDRLVTWHDVQTNASLAEGYLPIPSVDWESSSHVGMRITGLASGRADSSVLFVRYRLRNDGSMRKHGKLFVCARPFQVDPPWQIFTIVGGVSHVGQIHCDSVLHIDERDVVPLNTPSSSGASAFDQGDITRYLRRGMLPPFAEVHDHMGAASAGMEYDWDLAPGDSAAFVVAVPFEGSAAQYGLHPGMENGSLIFSEAYQRMCQYWHATLDNIHLALPSALGDVEKTLRSNLAFILIHRDGPGIQPGSRSYERSWIRDGSLIGASLLRMGIRDEVRDYIDWYSRFIRQDGFVPCIVDRRGAEAVPEHDSHGEFLYLAGQYFRFSHDTIWLRAKYPIIKKVAEFILRLRSGKSDNSSGGDAFDVRACAGLVPASISHEGYSEKPMHSYWDNFFCLRGLKDAALLADAAGDRDAARLFRTEVASYRSDITRSLDTVMRSLHLSYVPGCVELGDHGGLSNTIIVDPVDEVATVPIEALRTDFDQYWSDFQTREHGRSVWWAYLPYEWRYVGTFVELGWKDRAIELFGSLMADRRPPGWNGWGESVWRDRAAPKNIGDMPHAWVGSDFIRDVRNMFVYEREHDSTLVLGAGIPERWADDSAGVVIDGMPTEYGTISYRIQPKGKGYSISVRGTLTDSHVSIAFCTPRHSLPRSVYGDGILMTDGSLKLSTLPANTFIEY